VLAFAQRNQPIFEQGGFIASHPKSGICSSRPFHRGVVHREQLRLSTTHRQRKLLISISQEFMFSCRPRELLGIFFKLGIPDHLASMRDISSSMAARRPNIGSFYVQESVLSEKTIIKVFLIASLFLKIKNYSNFLSNFDFSFFLVQFSSAFGSHLTFLTK